MIMRTFWEYSNDCEIILKDTRIFWWLRDNFERSRELWRDFDTNLLTRRSFWWIARNIFEFWDPRDTFFDTDGNGRILTVIRIIFLNCDSHEMFFFYTDDRERILMVTRAISLNTDGHETILILTGDIFLDFDSHERYFSGYWQPREVSEGHGSHFLESNSHKGIFLNADNRER